MYSLKNKKIWVAGHNGMVGSSLLRRLLQEQDLYEIITVDHLELDLCRQDQVKDWMNVNKPDVVIIAAAKVGGIMANMHNPASFFYDNMMIAANIIHSSYEFGVEKLLFLGSSCIYPRECAQPISEDQLLKSSLEPSNEAYALAKISGLKMASYYRKQYGCDFISAMPCNLFGEGDSYDMQNSHVIPALIMKAHNAKIQGLQELVLWGSGSALREFMYVDDLADGLVFLLKYYSDEMHINIGIGQEISIKDLASLICEIVGYKGKIKFDNTKPDGTIRKLLDSSRLKEMAWKAPIFKRCNDDYKAYLRYGISTSYDDFLKRNL